MNKILLGAIAIAVILGGFYLTKDDKGADEITLPIVVDESALVEKYLRDNIKALAPEMPVLGGSWYVVSVTTDLTKNSGIVVYEDGHIEETKNFSYTTNENGEVASLTILGSNQVACTMEAKQCPDGSYVGRSGPKCEFAQCPSPSNKSGIKGRVTLSPTCPVERFPPDPNCAPKAYSTLIDIIKEGSTKILKTIQSDASGVFNVDLSLGSYVLQAHGGQTMPSCPLVLVAVKSNQYTNIEISCDTGIR